MRVPFGFVIIAVTRSLPKMVLKNGVPFCDKCGRELVALTEAEALADIMGHGWTDWRTAAVHYCFKCSDELWQPPCGECETHPCKRGRDCWASPPLHLFPYETYFANALGEDYCPVVEVANSDYETLANLEAEGPDLVMDVRRRQNMRIAGLHPKQKKLFVIVGGFCDE